MRSESSRGAALSFELARRPAPGGRYQPKSPKQEAQAHRTTATAYAAAIDDRREAHAMGIADHLGVILKRRKRVWSNLQREATGAGKVAGSYNEFPVEESFGEETQPG